MKLLDIADDFIKYMGIDWVEPKDIVMTGSLANYNWHEKYSDIDLHIIMDYSEIADNETIVDNYLYSQKELWNKDHSDINIYGFPVECFVENSESNDGVESGVYSLERDEWVEKPNREHLSTFKVNKAEIRKKIAWYINKVDELEFLYNEADDEFQKRKVYKRACLLWNKIKSEREKGFETSDNEMNQGNIIFKALRRRDCIERVTTIKAKLYDSLKSLNEGRKKVIKNDEGEIVPEKCTECGSDIGVYIQGEPVYKCTKCGKYYGTMPCTLYHSPKKKKKK
jgi:head-tail adaptor